MKKFLRLQLGPYRLTLLIYALFVVFALIVDTPRQIGLGMLRILTSQSLLVTDYIAVGGIGAALFNVAVVGFAGVLMLKMMRLKPSGALIMALWLTTGFAFFGKNLLNMLPIPFGIWLNAKLRGERFRNYALAALLSATISPLVSELMAIVPLPMPLNATVACLAGIAVGLVFPAVAAFCARVHDGYDLYNMGFAGGLIAMVTAAVLNGFGLGIETVLIWSTGNNLILAVLLYLTCAILIAYGAILSGGDNVKEKMREMSGRSGRLVSDFYSIFGDSVFINMGLLGILGTTTVLVLGADLNGPTMAGILTIAGFGCFGKHLKNVVPVLIGAILATSLNVMDMRSASGILSILFSTGLAPIAGQFGWPWGIAVGFLHVFITTYIGPVTSGVNLYNNGFAAGFVALILVPMINAVRPRRGEGHET
ncbi:MAG: DUF1576 domain-containing protein [Christensenellales bacterium]